jgi:hypothetical protein
VSPFNKTTQSKIAACEALGLSYWADHPATGCVWAVDTDQQAHVVRWYRPNNRSTDHLAALQQVGEPHREIWWDDRGDRKYRFRYPLADAGERVQFQAA